MRKRKICIIGPSRRFLSGISYYTIRLSNILACGDRVSLIYLRRLLPEFLFPGRRHIGRQMSGVETQNVRVFDGMDYNNPLTWALAFNFLKREKPDYLITQWWTSSVAHMLLIMKILNSMFVHAKVLIEFHEVVDPLEDSILPIRLYSRFMGRLLRKGADAYITHSISDKNAISGKYGIPRDRIYVIPHGLYDHYMPVDMTSAKSELSVTEDYVVLSFGLIREYKGVPYLIKAFEQLPPELAARSRLLIVGEIWEGRERLLSQLASSPLRGKITLIDRYVPDDEVSLYFSAADAVVLPYTRASQSGVAHIAMSFGKQVIVTSVGGLLESMSGYEGTVFVPPQDPDAIRLALEKGFQRRAVRFAPPARGWDAIAGIYRDVIDRLSGQRR